MPSLAEVQASFAAFGDRGLDVGDGSVESGGGETVGEQGVSSRTIAKRGTLGSPGDDIGVGEDVVEGLENGAVGRCDHRRLAK